MVISWLIISLTLDIGENFLLYPTTKVIWEAARDTYSSKDCTAELFEIKSLHEFKQGDALVTQYLTMLIRYWQQLDLFQVYKFKCSADDDRYRGILETKRIFKFLMGLNSQLDDVHSLILATKPLANLCAAFTAVRHEKSMRIDAGTFTYCPNC